MSRKQAQPSAPVARYTEAIREPGAVPVLVCIACTIFASLLLASLLFIPWITTSLAIITSIAATAAIFVYESR